MLERGIKQDIPVRLGVIPAGKSGHPGTDIKDTEEQEQAEPFIGAGLIEHAFSVQEQCIDESVNKKKQQKGAEEVKTELHAD